MPVIWLISYLSLWLLVVLLLLAVLVLARQVGMLHARLGPTGARMVNAGPEIGELAPQITALDLSGHDFTLGSARGKPTLMLFFTTSCSTCASLTPAIKALWKSEHDKLEIALVSMYSSDDETRQFVAQHKLTRISCTTSPEVSLEYRISSPPYGLLIDEERVVRAKGIVNNSEHLESLLNVIQLGHTSMEDWLKAQGARTVTVVTDMPVQ